MTVRISSDRQTDPSCLTLGLAPRGKMESLIPSSPLLHTLNCTTLPAPLGPLGQSCRETSLFPDFSPLEAISRANTKYELVTLHKENSQLTTLHLQHKEPRVTSQPYNILTTFGYWRRFLSAKCLSETRQQITKPWRSLLELSTSHSRGPLLHSVFLLFMTTGGVTLTSVRTRGDRRTKLPSKHPQIISSSSEQQ